jgi:hypothetical protein
MYILILITYLGGASWGPQVSMQEFSSYESCLSAQKVAVGMIDEMNKTNLINGHSFRQIVSGECVKK